MLTSLDHSSSTKEYLIFFYMHTHPPQILKADFMEQNVCLYITIILKLYRIIET